MKVHFVIVAVIAIFAVGCKKEQKGIADRYLIPDGYIGEIRIEYGVKKAPALPLEEGRHLLVIPRSGILQTSTQLDQRWCPISDYYYVKGNQRRRIPDQIEAQSLKKGDPVVLALGANVQPNANRTRVISGVIVSKYK